MHRTRTTDVKSVAKKCVATGSVSREFTVTSQNQRILGVRAQIDSNPVKGDRDELLKTSTRRPIAPLHHLFSGHSRKLLLSPSAIWVYAGLRKRILFFPFPNYNKVTEITCPPPCTIFPFMFLTMISHQCNVTHYCCHTSSSTGNFAGKQKRREGP